jgi:hypothetical protein
MIYIGISRSWDGTIGIIDENDKPVLVKVPWRYWGGRNQKHLDYKKFKELLQPYASTPMNEVRSQINAKALVEFPFNGKGINSGRGKVLASTRFFEAELAILEVLGISVEFIEPIDWHHDLFTGKFYKLTPKQASLEYGNELYPELKQNKAKDRDGICIAYYLKNIKNYKKRF